MSDPPGCKDRENKIDAELGLIHNVSLTNHHCLLLNELVRVRLTNADGPEPIARYDAGQVDTIVKLSKLTFC